MSYFQNARNTDARHGTYNNVAGSQQNVSGNFNAYYIQVGSLTELTYGSRQHGTLEAFAPNLASVEPWSLTLPARLSPEILALINLLDTAVKYLRSGATASDYRDLIAEIESFRLVLTRFTTTSQQHQDVINAITVLSAQCSSLIKSFYNKMNDRGLWRKFAPGVLKANEVSNLKKELFERRAAITVLVETYSDRRGEDHAPGRTNQSLMQQRAIPSSVGYAVENGIRLVDALGKTTVFPIELCYSVKSFHSALKSLFTDRAGERYVERGDYDLASDEDKQIIGADEWDTKVKIGTVLFVNIILRRMESEDHRKECPRCHDKNFGVRLSEGWIDCRFCDARFQVSRTENEAVEEIRSLETKPGNAERPVHNADEEMHFFRNIHLILNAWPRHRVIEFVRDLVT